MPQTDLNKMTPQQLAELGLKETADSRQATADVSGTARIAAATQIAAATPSRHVSMIDAAEKLKPRRELTPHELAVAGLSGHRFDHEGDLVDPRGARLGEVR